MVKNNSKDLEELSVQDKLKALYKLQLVTSEIDRIRIIRGELPEEVRDLEDEIEGRHTRYKKDQDEIAELNRLIGEYKESTTNSNDLIKKYNEQLHNISNNREYDLLVKEIEYQNLEIQGFEKDTRLAKERIARLEEAMQELSQETEDREKDLELKRTELDTIISETKEQEDKLHDETKELEAKIDERLLRAFHRTRDSYRNGLAVVTIDRGACKGCFNKIPPQRIIDIQSRKKITACEYCGRVLVDPELAEESAREIDLQ